MSRKARSYTEIISGDVASVTECIRVFQNRGFTKRSIYRAYNEAVALEQNRPHGSIFLNGERVELRTICKVLNVSHEELKKAVPPWKSSTAS